VADLKRWAKMIRYLSVIILLCGFCHGAEPKPVLVVVEEDSWGRAIGSGSPSFALYEDGTLFYLREKPSDEVPFYARRVADAKAKRTELLGFDPRKMQARYEISSGSDQPTTVIWTPAKRIEIYGNWRRALQVGSDSDPTWKEVVDRERKFWESLPTPIRATLMRIDQERSIEGRIWFPTKVEIMLWPYEYAPDVSIRWPKDWPGLAAKDTRKSGGSFFVLLSSELWPELQTFLATRKEKGAVLIDGKKMAARTRFPFPGEEAWMR
jgi:hypothetical protein